MERRALLADADPPGLLRDIRFDPALLYGEDTLFFVMEFLEGWKVWRF